MNGVLVVTLLVLFSVGLSASAEPPQALCKELRQFTEASVPAKQVLNQLVQPNIQVVGLYESHFQSAFFSLPQVVRQIRNIDPNYDCLFMEFLPGYEPVYPKGSVPDSETYRHYYRLAHDLNMKIFFVDAKKSDYEDDEYLNTLVRNRDMSDNIAAHFNSKQCRKGVLIVGKAHGYSFYINRPMPSIKYFLRQNSIETASIEIEDLWVGVDTEGRIGNVLDQKIQIDNPQNQFTCGAKTLNLKGRGFIQKNTPTLCSSIRYPNTEKWPDRSYCDFDGVLFY